MAPSRGRAAVIATGTYLGGRTMTGEVVRDSGPDGLVAALPLTDCLVKLGLSIRRFKTGTPPRVNRRSVDFSQMQLQEGDEVVTVVPVNGESQVVLVTTGGVFLKFLLEEISLFKKASRGVRGIKLAKNEELEQLILLGEDTVLDYKGKEVHLNRLKLAKRDGKGSKIRL